MNIYNDCPIDARDFTDYRSSSDIHNEMIVKEKLEDQHSFNRFITDHGVNHFLDKKKKIEELYGCGTYDNTMLSEKYTQICNKKNCKIENNKNDGLGTGRKMTINTKNVVNNNLVSE